MAKVYNRIIGYNTTKCFVKLLQGGRREVRRMWSEVCSVGYREGFMCVVGVKYRLGHLYFEIYVLLVLVANE